MRPNRRIKRIAIGLIIVQKNDPVSGFFFEK